MIGENTKGIVTSAAVHGLLLGSMLLFSGIAGKDTEPEQKEREGTIINVKMEGPGLAGIKDKRPGPADGSKSGDITKQGHAPLFDQAAANKAIRELQKRMAAAEKEEERRRQLEAEQEKKQSPEKEKPDDVKKPDKTKKPDASGKKTGGKDKDKISWDEWNSSAKGGQKSGSKNPPGGSKSGKTGKSPGITGSTIDVGGYGIKGGSGENGGEGGGKITPEMYRDNISDRIRDELSALIEEEGAGLDPSLSGRCRINVSNRGNISFGGWTNDPESALFESLLRRAIDRVGNCGIPPPGMASSFNQPVTAKLREY